MDYMKRQAILSLIEATAACARQVSVEDVLELVRGLPEPDSPEMRKRWRLAWEFRDYRCALSFLDGDARP